MTTTTLIGPFKQILTMDNLNLFGHLKDQELHIIENGGIVVENGKIKQIGNYNELKTKNQNLIEIEEPSVLIPGLIDAHTHICYAGNRANDYAARLAGKTYHEIAKEGGGISDTLCKTRAATEEELIQELTAKTNQLLKNGVTTCEVKSGYGLNVKDEIKMLRAIKSVDESQPIELVSTCLGAHIRPKEFDSNTEYLEYLARDLLVLVKSLKLSKRVDIFIDQCAFTIEEARPYLKKAKDLGFTVCIHADQFTRGSAQLAAEVKAISADHLEVSNEQDFQALKEHHVIPIVLPGSSLGLGLPFAPAKKMLDAHLPLVIASDWNPGSAPNGDLLMQASVLGIYEKLTTAEIFAGITFRAAKALEFHDRGILREGLKADMIAFPCDDFREILYHQGSLKPSHVFVNGSEHG